MSRRLERLACDLAYGAIALGFVMAGYAWLSAWGHIHHGWAYHWTFGFAAFHWGTPVAVGAGMLVAGYFWDRITKRRTTS